MLLQDRFAASKNAGSGRPCPIPANNSVSRRCTRTLASGGVTGRHQLRHISPLRASPAEVIQQILENNPQNSHNSEFGDDYRTEPDAEPGPRPAVGVPEVSFVSLVDGKFTVRGRLVLPVPAGLVYDVLTDYGSCPRVFSNIEALEVVRDDAGAKEMVQTCRWAFLAFSGTFRVHLGVTEDAARRALLFSLVQSSFMRDFEGRWEVAPIPAPGTPSDEEATEGPSPPPASYGRSYEWCEVRHQLAVVPAVPVPPPVAYYTRSIFVRQVEGILLDLQRGVEAAQAEGVASGREVAEAEAARKELVTVAVGSD